MGYQITTIFHQYRFRYGCDKMKKKKVLHINTTPKGVDCRVITLPSFQ